MGLVLKVERLRNTPWCSSLASLNNFHSRAHPFCAKVELMKRSCFRSASVTEQLGPTVLFIYLGEVEHVAEGR